MQKRELLSLARDLREWLSSKDYGGNTFSIMREDGGHEDFIDNVCYQKFRYVEKNENNAIFIVDMVRSHLSKKLSLEYINWWVNDSFIADAFVTKKEETILKKGSIMDCSYPSSYVVLAMIGLRYMWEFPEIIRNWGMFKEFTDYNAAIIMAHMFIKEANEEWSGSFKVNNSNHTWFQTYWNKKEFTQAVNNDLSGLKELLPMKNHMAYSPLISIFSPNRTVSYKTKKGSLIYPPSHTSKTVKNSFGGIMKSPVKIYNKCDMEVWIRKTFDLNYLKEKKNES